MLMAMTPSSSTSLKRAAIMPPAVSTRPTRTPEAAAAGGSAATPAAGCGGPHARRAQAWRKTFSSSISQAPSRVVQKQSLQAGFGNAHVAQFHARGLRGVDDRRNQRAAAVCIDVRGAVVHRAHFQDARKRL